VSVGLLRERGRGETRVTPVELFFDLVYVLAVTQLAHHLLDDLSLRGAGETLLLLLAVWSAWAYTSWITNWFDPDGLPVRLMLVGVMLGSLVMSASLPEAFGERGLAFAAAFVAIQVGRTAFVLAALGRRHQLTSNFPARADLVVGAGLALDRRGAGARRCTGRRLARRRGAGLRRQLERVSGAGSGSLAHQRLDDRGRALGGAPPAVS
jgi:low temperature requirement protein LtrA